MGLKVIKNPDIREEELHVNQWEPYGDCPCCDSEAFTEGLSPCAHWDSNLLKKLKP
jgi:hypothetical protein